MSDDEVVASYVPPRYLFSSLSIPHGFSFLVNNSRDFGWHKHHHLSGKRYWTIYPKYSSSFFHNSSCWTLYYFTSKSSPHVAMLPTASLKQDLMQWHPFLRRIPAVIGFVFADQQSCWMLISSTPFSPFPFPIAPFLRPPGAVMLWRLTRLS